MIAQNLLTLYYTTIYNIPIIVGLYRKSQDPKMMKNHKMVTIGQRVVFCGSKKPMMSIEVRRIFLSKVLE